MCLNNSLFARLEKVDHKLIDHVDLVSKPKYKYVHEVKTHGNLSVLHLNI